MTSEVCMDKLLDFICRFGSPLQLNSDQGRQFIAGMFHSMCDLLGVKKTRSSPRHPACNGLVERYNGTVVGLIRAYMKGQQNEWDKNLCCIEEACKSTPSESTGFSANMLMLGREVRMPIDLIFPNPKFKNDICIGKAHQLTRKHLKTSAFRKKENYDVRISFHTYKIGDIVWLLDETRAVGRCHKLQDLWKGPYIISRKHSDLDYEIQISGRGNKTVVHHDKLKQCHYQLGDLPGWLVRVRNSLPADDEN
jgi:hypothetical protein